MSNAVGAEKNFIKFKFFVRYGTIFVLSDEKQVPALHNGARARIVYSSLIRIVTAPSRISTTPTIRFRRRISQRLANFAETTAPNRHEATTIAMGSGKSCVPSEMWLTAPVSATSVIIIGLVPTATGLNQSVKQLSDK